MAAKGWAARLGSAKYDLSMLFVYVAMDMYLAKRGSLGFVITQSVFQSDAGTGFRRFSITSKQHTTPFCPARVDDMTGFQPFSDASNRTSTVVFRRDLAPKYPVPYAVWSPAHVIQQDMTLAEVLDVMTVEERAAEPVDQGNPTSRWLIGGDAAASAVARVLGHSDYRAETGSYTEGANGVYWVEILRKTGKTTVLVRNIVKGLKRPVPQVTQAIEAGFLRPLLRSGDVRRWRYNIDAYLIFTGKHLGDSISETTMKREYPKLYGYFSQFRQPLKARKSFAGKMARAGYPFYAMYGAKSMESAHKVLWKRMGSSVDAVVVGPTDDTYLHEVVPIPQETLIFVPFEDLKAAHYLCALLNSRLVSETARRYSLEGSKSFASVHLLENVGIPRFDQKNASHRALARLSAKCHEAARADNASQVRKCEQEIDLLAARLWGLSDLELNSFTDCGGKPNNKL
ncbi:MAG: hypothetical protein JSV16_09805, partial [Candidatus Hydrogenedentota bacterium]